MSRRRKLAEVLGEPVGLDLEPVRLHTGRPTVSARRRKRIFKRDGYRCRNCGSTRDLTIDHIRPLARGGTNARGNLQTLCQTCNEAKGDEWARVTSR